MTKETADQGSRLCGWLTCSSSCFVSRRHRRWCGCFCIPPPWLSWPVMLNSILDLRRDVSVKIGLPPKIEWIWNQVPWFPASSGLTHTQICLPLVRTALAPSIGPSDGQDGSRGTWNVNDPWHSADMMLWQLANLIVSHRIWASLVEYCFDCCP